MLQIGLSRTDAAVMGLGAGARRLQPDSECIKKRPGFPGALSIQTDGSSQTADQAAAFSTEPSTTCADGAEVAIGMLRGFLASGISRERSTWRRPFSSEAFFTTT